MIIINVSLTQEFVCFCFCNFMDTVVPLANSFHLPIRTPATKSVDISNLSKNTVKNMIFFFVKLYFINKAKDRACFTFYCSCA